MRDHGIVERMGNRPMQVSRVTAIASPLSVLAIETTMLIWERMIGAPQDAIYALSKEPSGFIVLLATLCTASFILIARYCYPTAVLAAQLMLCLTTSYWHADSVVMIPLLIAFYAFMRTVNERRMHIGSVAVILTTTLATFLSWPANRFLSEWPGRILVFAAIGAFALARRSMIYAKTAHSEASSERRQARLATMQRDAAIRRSRIAGQLHDSVGHGLTAIIALSEGLAGKTGDKHIEGALTGINEIARETLTDTRNVVRALADLDTSGSAGENDADLRSWDDIRPILARARSMGRIVVFSETGSRPGDELQANMCFDVTRESITNAIRHAPSMKRINVAWDHDDQGGVLVAIRNDTPQAGTQEKQASHNRPQAGTSPDGTGLIRLSQRLQSIGGTLEYGPTEDGSEWYLKAFIPPIGAKSTDQGIES